LIIFTIWVQFIKIKKEVHVLCVNHIKMEFLRSIKRNIVF